MGKTWNAPGTCADCGNDAFIRMAINNGAEDMLCAHCYAEHMRVGKKGGEVRETTHVPHVPPRMSGVRPQ